MTRMFTLGGEKRIKTWQVFVGCNYRCLYCWGPRWAKRRKHCAKCLRFTPHLHEDELYSLPKNPRKHHIVFVAPMADMWGSFVSKDDIEAILNAVDYYSRNPHYTWFFETKNPGRFREFIDQFPKKTILSTTIETDSYPYKVTEAPSPYSRYIFFKNLPWEPKHVSIEPVMKFNEDKLLWMITNIDGLKFISIGVDNYGHRLPEPSPEEFWRLVNTLRELGYIVEVKTAPENRNRSQKRRNEITSANIQPLDMWMEERA